MLTHSDLVKIAINAPPMDPAFRQDRQAEDPNLTNFQISMMWRQTYTANIAALVHDAFSSQFMPPAKPIHLADDDPK